MHRNLHRYTSWPLKRKTWFCLSALPEKLASAYIALKAPKALCRRSCISTARDGSWGGPTTHDRLVRELATGSHAVVIFVDYDRSPEARYPVAIEQDYAVLKYVADHPQEFRIDPKRVATAGDSVGGNMVAVVSQLIKERQGPALAAQVLFYPVTDAAMNDGSYKEFANGPWLTAAAMKYFWGPIPDSRSRHHAAAHLALECAARCFEGPSKSIGHHGRKRRVAG